MSFLIIPALTTTIQPSQMSNFQAMVLLESIPFSADSNKISGTLQVYNNYYLQFNFQPSAGGNLSMQINGDTGANYATHWINGVTPTSTGGATSINLGDANANIQHIRNIWLTGKTPAVAGGWLSLICQGGYFSVGKPLIANWAGGNDVQVETIKLMTSVGTLPGTLNIYGYD